MEMDDLNIKCLQILRGIIHNEERKLPEDWQTRMSERKIKKFVAFIFIHFVFRLFIIEYFVCDNTVKMLLQLPFYHFYCVSKNKTCIVMTIHTHVQNLLNIDHRYAIHAPPRKPMIIILRKP